MPADLTILAAKYLVFIEGLLAAAAVGALLYRAPRTSIIRWAVAVGAMLVVAYVAAQVSGALYHDPRPFAVEHFRPLIAHEADNGFPSDHALLAAAIVAAVAFARLLWALPFTLLAGLVDWARVGVGVHHPIDVIGSTGCVLLGAIVAVAVATAIAKRVQHYVPARLLDLVAEPERRIA